MTAQELAAIVARHLPTKAEWPECAGCEQDWPCDTFRLLALLRETREAAREYLAAEADQ